MIGISLGLKQMKTDGRVGDGRMPAKKSLPTVEDILERQEETAFSLQRIGIRNRIMNPKDDEDTSKILGLRTKNY